MRRTLLGLALGAAVGYGIGRSSQPDFGRTAIPANISSGAFASDGRKVPDPQWKDYKCPHPITVKAPQNGSGAVGYACIPSVDLKGECHCDPTPIYK